MDADTGREGVHRPPWCVQQKDSLSKQVGAHVGQYVHPQEFVGVGVHNQLHEPARFSHRPGPAHPSHQLLTHLDLTALLHRLGFGETDTRHLRVGEHRVRTCAVS